MDYGNFPKHLMLMFVEVSLSIEVNSATTRETTKPSPLPQKKRGTMQT